MRRILLSIILLAAVFVPALSTVPVFAATGSNAQALCEGSGGTWKAGTNGSGTCTSSDNRTLLGTFKQIANILLFIIGAVAVVMLIIGGFKYVTSQGDQNAVSSAKNTILYAVIGLVVAFMAFAVVNFVLTALKVK